MDKATRDTLLKLKRMRDDFSAFGQECLKVRTKEGETVPFIMNEPQKYVHGKIEEQRLKTGKVRALILKGRQQGMSTYVAARYYWQASLRSLTNVFIMAHTKDASDGLFKIVDRYHTHNPLRPQTDTSNAKQLVFDKLDSSYDVGTAGQKAGGRGRTISLYHGSEVAFWENAADHFAASIQAVSGADNTEILLESTANGPTGEFYARWQDAEAGRGDYIAIFVPWFWSPEYSRPDLVNADFILSTEREDGDLSEAEYAELFGLNNAQMAWRRAKIVELRNPKLFKQEYPATPDEAFQSANTDSFIQAATCVRAAKNKDDEGSGPLILGVDPAGPGGDRFAIAFRRGYVCEKIIWRDKIEAPQANAWLKSIIDEHKPAAVFIDAGGIGAATISLIRNEGVKYQKLVRPVNFGSPSEHKKAKPKVPGPKNRRAEMWSRLKDWLSLDEGVSIPDIPALTSDLVGPTVKDSATNDLVLESKNQMRKRGIRSPDLADALALTFASLRVIEKWEEREQKPDPVHVNPDVPAHTHHPSPVGGKFGWMG